MYINPSMIENLIIKLVGGENTKLSPIDKFGFVGLSVRLCNKL
jgi:hypothetical protein